MASSEGKQLTELERLVERAKDRIVALAAENLDLRKQLDEAEASGETSEKEWQKQRKKVEAKLEDLVARLSTALDQADS